MAIIKIRDYDVDVDIERELSNFNWYRAKWHSDRLIACSPFRYDSSPSFYVYLEDTSTAFAGSWGDSGGDGDFQKGHLAQLLAFLTDCTEHEIEEYLLDEYASEWNGEGGLTLDMSNLVLQKSEVYLDMGLVEEFTGSSEYLRGRGITDEVQALYNVAYDEEKSEVLFPYVLPNGRLAALKKRRTDSKAFFYEGGGRAMRELVYGIDISHRDDEEIAIITEAEIDAMYATVCTGILGIGVGTSSFSDEKADVIRRSPLKEIIIASDNDKAGEKLKAQIIQKLGGLVQLYTIRIPDGKKDLNDMTEEEVRYAIEHKEAVVPTLFGV